MLSEFIVVGLYLLGATYVVWVVGPRLGSAFVDRLYKQATEELKKRDKER